MTFTRQKVAVYVDGCFWHGCPTHYVPPKTNPEYWSGKIIENMKRDRDTDRRMADEGWLVLRFWEHEDPQVVANAVLKAVRERR